MSLTTCLALVLGLGSCFSAEAQQLAKTRIQQLPAQPYYCFYQLGDTLFVGGPDRIYRSRDPQIGIWDSTSKVPNASTLDDFLIDNDVWFAASLQAGVYQSSDRGQNWTRSTPAQLGGVTTLCKWQGTLYAGTQGNGVYAYQPTNGTWLPFNNGLALSLAGTINDLAANDTALFAAAGANGLLYYYSLQRNIWDYHKPVGTFVPGLNFNQVIVAPPRIMALAGIRQYTSLDGGSTWQLESNGLLTRGASDAKLVKTDSVILLAINYTTSRSANLYSKTYDALIPDNWELVTTQPSTHIYDCTIRGSILYQAEQTGLYYFDNITLNLPTAGQPSPILGLYPNPSDGGLVKIMGLSENASVSLTDMMGQVIEINGSTIDTHQLAKGLYVVKAGAGVARLVVR